MPDATLTMKRSETDQHKLESDIRAITCAMAQIQ